MTVLNLADALKVGGSDVARAYLGSALVWEPAGESPTSATLTIPGQASMLTDFVTRVDIAHLPAPVLAEAGSDGGNLRVKQGGAVIPFDLVAFDQGAGTGELFFKATLGTSPNVFTIDADGTGLLSATDANGRNAVWSDYEAVILGGQAINRRDGTAANVYGTVALDSSGLWDTPGGGGGHLTIDSLARFTQWTTACTVITDKTTGDQHFLSYGILGTSNTTVATQGFNGGGGGANFKLWNSTNSWTADTGSLVDVTIGARTRSHYVHDGSTSRTGYRAGVEVVTASTALRPGGSGACGLYVGTGTQTSSNSLDGRIGYAYLRGGLLAPAWIAAEYASWETPAAFYTIT